MRKLTGLCLAMVIVGGLLFPARAASAAEAEVTPEQVTQAIERGVLYLRSAGTFKARARYGIGMNGLAVLAMIHCGVPPNDPDVVRGAQMCADPKHWQDNTYHVGCIAAALAAVDGEAYRPTIKKCADWLIGAQNKDGGWRYRSARAYAERMKKARKAWEERVKQNPRLRTIRRNWNARVNQMSDHSCTQFALLGLRAAHEAGVPVPAETWKRAEKYLVDSQLKDGGWSYTSQSRGKSYGSMTAAGLGSLYICGMKLHQRSPRCGVYMQNKRIAKALDWLAKHFSVTENPGRGQTYVGYYLYALERACAFSGRRHIGKHDWYAEGAAHLVRTQRADGSWHGRHRVDLETVFNLLFLGKASASVLVQKLAYGAGWNTDYYDADHLSKQVSRELKLKCTWQTVRLSDPVDVWLEAPILYVTGHGRLDLTAKQRAKLRAFCERGGTIVADACCMNDRLDTSFRAQMKEIFPEVPLADLPAGHPVYSLRHKIRVKRLQVWEGITTGCRTAVFYSKRDLSCAWDGNIHDARLAVDERNAFRMGVNVAAYAMGYKPLKDKLAEVPPSLVQESEIEDDGKVARGALVFAQLKHGGDWDPDPTAAKAMLYHFAKATGAKVDLERVDLEPTDPRVYKYPLLYMTGHREFRYTKEQVEALRRYLDRGGFLLADACCGRAEFDKAFRGLVDRLFPEEKLERLPEDHKIFRIKHRINSTEYLPILKQERPGLKGPFLEAIVVDGRAVLVYSKFDVGCAFEGFPCAACRGVTLRSGKKLLTNILVYAMTE